MKVKIHRNKLLGDMCEAINHYQEFMVHVRYNGNKFDDPIWKRNTKRGSYGFVPTKGALLEVSRAMEFVLAYLTEKMGRPNFSFLDAGCGAGNILLIANAIGFNELYGIELDDKTVKIANDLLSCAIDNSRFKIIKANLTKYSKYKNYDVIYYYQPMKHLSKFLDLLRKNVKVGTIIITNGDNPFREDRKFKKIMGGVAYQDGVYEKMR